MNVIERAKAYVGTCNKDGFGCRCEARVSAECGCSGVKWASAGESASIITDLLSIVERLPKDAEGNPVLIDEEYMRVDRSFVRYVAEVAGDSEDYYSPTSLDWDKMIPAAAEAAREGE